MADGIEVKLEGVDSIQAKMRAVADAARDKAARRALGKAAQVIRDRARASAARVDRPLTPENIARNVTVQWASKTFRKTGDPTWRIGVLGGAKKHSAGIAAPGGDTWYWRLLEFGTEHAPAQPIFRPILNHPDERVIGVFCAEFEAELDRLRNGQ